MTVFPESATPADIASLTAGSETINGSGRRTSLHRSSTDRTHAKRPSAHWGQSRGDATANADVPTTQDFLAHKGDHNCMIYIVVRGVARGDVLECQLGDKAHHTRKSWLLGSVRAVVHLTKFANECGDDDLRRIEHRLTALGSS